MLGRLAFSFLIYIGRASCVLPFAFAVMARMFDVFAYSAWLRQSGVNDTMAMVTIAIFMLALILVAMAGSPLRTAGLAAILFSCLKYHADQTISSPVITCPSTPSGRCVIAITGADSSIGIAISQALIIQGHTVVLGCRTSYRCKYVQKALRETPGQITDNIIALAGLDLKSLREVSMWAFNLESAQQAGRFGKVDIVILSGSHFPVGSERTKEGFEAGLGLMYIAHFALIYFMRQQLALAANVRVVTLSSMFMHFGSFHRSLFDHEHGEGDLRGEITTGCTMEVPLCTPALHTKGSNMTVAAALDGNWGSYARGKLANVLFARELARRGTLAASANPGSVYIPIGGSGLRSRLQALCFELVLRPPDVAASIILAAANASTRGSYVNAMGEVVPDSFLPSKTVNDFTAKRLWDVTEGHIKRWDEGGLLR